MRGVGAAFVIALAAGLSAGPVVGQGVVRGTVSWRGRPASDAVVILVGTAAAGPVGEEEAVIDQRHLRFAPRVVAIQPGDAVEFVNSDPIMHNVFSPGQGGANFDLGTYPQFESRVHRFPDAGIFVVLCHVHPEMVAWVAVVESAWHAVTDPAGGFVIEDVPQGEYAVQVSRRGATVRLDEPLTVGPLGTSNLRLTIDPDPGRRSWR